MMTNHIFSQIAAFPPRTLRGAALMFAAYVLGRVADRLWLSACRAESQYRPLAKVYAIKGGA